MPKTGKGSILAQNILHFADPALERAASHGWPLFIALIGKKTLNLNGRANFMCVSPTFGGTRGAKSRYFPERREPKRGSVSAACAFK